jgi:hypothetical protein
MVLETAIHIHKPEPSPHRSSSNIEFRELKREEQEEETPLIPSPRQEAGDVVTTTERGNEEGVIIPSYAGGSLATQRPEQLAGAQQGFGGNRQHCADDR